MAPIVLLLDADPAVRDALGFYLRSDGLQVRCYRDGIGLLADPILYRASALVVSNSPPDTDGFTVIEQLRLSAIEIPIVLLAARATAELRHRAAAIGVRCVLEKPLLDESFTRALACVLSQGDGRAQVRKSP